jgi:hypothetical protein
MNQVVPILILAVHDIELDPVTVEFAIGRLEALSVP